MTSSISDATRTTPEDWRYVSEGGATMVFSYVGPSDPEFDHTVLRLRKEGPEAAIEYAELEDSDDQGPEEIDDPSIPFQRYCMQRLIPPVHLPKLEAVKVSPKWLKALFESHHEHRPEKRRERAGLDVHKHKGVLATDLVGGDIVAVEIKPKWSFLPNTSYLSGTSKVIKSRTCRFCMHSRMKNSKGDTVSVGYCPLDLFSEDPARIENALNALWDAWIATDGKVNNLKVFVHGQKIHVAERSVLLEDASQHISDEELKAVFIRTIMPLLLNTPVLRILNRLQRSLDILDIEGLSTLWTSVYPDMVLGAGIPDPSLAEWNEFINEYIATASEHEPKIPELKYYIFAYLLSATFKDCSVMVRMDLLSANAPETLPHEVEASRVKVIDLDPKSMDRLTKWEELDGEIVKSYGHVLEEERRQCVDGWIDTGLNLDH